MQPLAAAHRAVGPDKRQREAGAVLVFAMGMVLVVIYIGAMVIDTMRIEMTRRTLRRTADAAAIAAALELRPTDTNPLERRIGWIRAKRASIAAVRSNQVQGIDLGALDFTGDCKVAGSSQSGTPQNTNDILCSGTSSSWNDEAMTPGTDDASGQFVLSGSPTAVHPYHYRSFKFGDNLTLHLARGEYSGGEVKKIQEDAIAAKTNIDDALLKADSSEVSVTLDRIPTVLMNIFGFTSVGGFQEEKVKSTPDK